MALPIRHVMSDCFSASKTSSVVRRCPPAKEHQRGPVLQDQSSILHPGNDLPHHTLGESLLIDQAATIVGSHQSYVSLRMPSNWPRNGFRYSSTKCSISASSLLSMSLTSQADKMDFG